MRNKKEYAIGEEVQVGDVTFICSQNNGFEVCDMVYTFIELECSVNNCYRRVGNCRAQDRTDNKDVIFKLKT